jgi:hypothetical protein
MQIANPIYDVVFKFLMEDSRSAKSLLSALIQQEIIELDFLPQEISLQVGAVAKNNFQSMLEKSSLTIYRMDFSAKIKTSEGEKQIVIELQKARLSEDISRFRKYLGKQYLNKELFVWAKTPSKLYKAGIPIFAIYFLGYELDAYRDIPVLTIENCVKDRFSQEKLTNNEPFIESLFHEGLIVIIPALKNRRRNELEKLLSIFDQSNREQNFHILNVNENDFPEKYRYIIRRLQAASESDEMRDKMLAEDDFMSEIQELERSKDEALEQVQEERRQKEEANRQKEEANRQKEEANRQKELAEQKASETQHKLVLAVKNLLSKGFSTEQIAQIIGITEEEVKNTGEKF